MISYIMNKINQIENKIEQIRATNRKWGKCHEIVGTMDAIRSKPMVSKFNFRAKGEWIRVGITKQLSMTFMASVRLTVEADLSCMMKTNHQFS